MAGHSKFKNIQHRKSAQDAKRAKLFTKILKDLYHAAKSGADPSLNQKLRTVIAHAKSVNVPKSRIDSAILKATSSGNGENYEEVRYEGFIYGVACIVEVLTDNRNRAAGNVRSIFNKYGASLGEVGCVSCMFSYVGAIYYDTDVCNEDELLEVIADTSVIDFCISEDYYVCFAEPQKFCEVVEQLENKLGKCVNANLTWRAKELVNVLDQDKLSKIEKFLEALEDTEDVQAVSTNLV
ncbi:YebC/PmpR family DNA-binding transcriptional regulator [Candidatus Sneabacter namystus]|uniref:Probable transcriptional regulatory protein FZC37_02985 n=1 Tax=Candidatus Sneabacter namystus TaxID=2601646 RepID=A0A5C0UJS7_9RICK|nr:YebC/PmpR family DNA-binding transcriptional regulator [Candidatus Sneabacter namystus]QEK39871.1 YebC/PmpR family DNA-binding transcriptional regulator [Candidatus Sneabacter namystus]